jgi:pilus assembly protein Flp/PilA
MMSRLKTFFADESGATAVEYALLAGFLALVVIASLSVIGSKLNGTFNQVASNIN